ncbi:MAG: hypothetical protein AAFW87_06170 [Pseudomonadota bacterium]
MTEPRVACKTPADGRDGVTNIPKWKFDLLRRAILDVLRRGEIEFRGLKDAVRADLASVDLAALGSIGWHVTTAKLELDVRGEVDRVPGQTPQVIRLAKAT